MGTPEGRGQGVGPELRGEINHTHISQPDRNVQMAGTSGRDAAVTSSINTGEGRHLSDALI